jgi:2'-hydroxyisoflavone reductase
MSQTKKILVLGGTAFVGRVIVEQLQMTGIYDITLFNRGKTNANLFPDIKRIIGNREQAEDIKLLSTQNWDAVIDVSGYYPLSLQALADMFKGRVGRYIFVSTASVYQFDENNTTPIDENYQLETCSEAEKIDQTMATYGKRKVACEEVLLNSGIDTIILRPAVIYGKYDPFDRHYYWLYRATQSKRVLIPAETHSTTRHNSTYVLDFANIVLKAVETPQHQRIYNTTTHPIISLRELVMTMATVNNNNPEWIIASLAFLEAEKIQPWTDLPLWINGDFLMLDNTRLLNDLQPTLTPLAESLKQTATYYENLKWYLPKAGISLPDEDELIELFLHPKKYK